VGELGAKLAEHDEGQHGGLGILQERHRLGERHVSGPTLANISEQFGLSILVGKSVAIIADPRISARTDTAVLTERLLSISGEDTLSIPRKFLPVWNGRLSARISAHDQRAATHRRRLRLPGHGRLWRPAAGSANCSRYNGSTFGST